ncbi:hypothetical protein GCM10010236_81380 [Streptomyces eurythermus]|nr:hypothetical protein GCM10010236_81380 [Streptomyces eurythermus]
MAERLVDDIFTALDEQTVPGTGTGTGTGTLDVIVPSPAKSPAAVHENNAGPRRAGSRHCWRPALFPRS